MLKKIAGAYSLCSFGYIAHSLLYFPNLLRVLEPSYSCISVFSLTFYFVVLLLSAEIELLMYFGCLVTRCSLSPAYRNEGFY